LYHIYGFLKKSPTPPVKHSNSSRGDAATPFILVFFIVG